MIEIMRFRLAPGVDENEFVRIDKELQESFAYQQPGLLRRTTAKGDGTWIVIDLWRSEEDADACGAKWDEADLPRRFMSMVDPDSVATERYDPIR